MKNYAELYRYRIGSTTNILGRPPQFYDSSSLHQGGCKFASVYAVTEEDAQAIQHSAQTAAGYKGTVWSQKLWIDFDDRQAGEEAQEALKNSGLAFVVYDTGNRGFHIGIGREAKPSHVLPLQDKQYVATTFPKADLSLYWHLHLIRLPGVAHEKTGEIKRLVYEQEGKALVLPLYEPPPAFTNTPGALNQYQGKQRGSIFREWNVVDKLNPDPNNRQGSLVNLALALKNDGNLNQEEALWVTAEANRGLDNPKSDNDIERIVKWVYEEKR